MTEGELMTAVCPPWCEVAQEDHIAGLPDREGRAPSARTVGGCPDELVPILSEPPAIMN